MKINSFSSSCSRSGFTLVELLLSLSIISLLAVVLVSMTHETSQLWRRTTGKIEQFREARIGFEAITRRLGQATLNTYWDYEYPKDSQGRPDTAAAPKSYTRQSELRFISGRMDSFQIPATSGVARPTHGVFFQAPIGLVDDASQFGQLDELLNTWGYFLEVGPDTERTPGFLKTLIPPRMRSRLMELSQPSENLSIYNITTLASRAWFADPITAKPRQARVLAENVMALIFLPRLSTADEDARENRSGTGEKMLTTDFFYDSTESKEDPEINSKNQLPPVVQVIMVSIDEQSARRLTEMSPDDTSFGLELDDKFLRAEYLEDDPGTEEPGDGDLFQFEKELRQKRANVRIFSSNVAIRGAKWSKHTSENTP